MAALARSKFLAQIEIVIDQEFFVLSNCPDTGKPEAFAFLFDSTIRMTTMVDVSCRTPLRPSVHIVLGIELDNVIRSAQ